MPAPSWHLSRTIRSTRWRRPRRDLPAAMKMLSMDSGAYRNMRDGEGDAVAVAARDRRSRLAVLHLRHHRPAQGRDAQPRQSGGGDVVLPRRCRSGDAGRCLALCRADLAWRRSLQSPACPHGRAARHSRIRRLRSGRSAQSRPAARQCRDVRRAHHGAAAGRCRQDAAARTARGCAPSSMAAGRCISPTSATPSPPWGSALCRSTARANRR